MTITKELRNLKWLLGCPLTFEGFYLISENFQKLVTFVFVMVLSALISLHLHCCKCYIPFSNCTTTPTLQRSHISPTTALPLNIWLAVSGSFCGVSCFSIALFTSSHCPAWCTPYICVQLPSLAKIRAYFSLFSKRKKDLKLSAAGCLTCGAQTCYIVAKQSGGLD